MVMRRVCSKCGTLAGPDPKAGCAACGASVYALIPVKK
jgi:uncharacterized OB-fold protein